MSLPPLKPQRFYQAACSCTAVCIGAGTWMWGSYTGNETLKTLGKTAALTSALAAVLFTAYGVRQLYHR